LAGARRTSNGRCPSESASPGALPNDRDRRWAHRKGRRPMRSARPVSSAAIGLRLWIAPQSAVAPQPRMGGPCGASAIRGTTAGSPPRVRAGERAATSRRAEDGQVAGARVRTRSLVNAAVAKTAFSTVPSRTSAECSSLPRASSSPSCQSMRAQVSASATAQRLA